MKLILRAIAFATLVLGATHAQAVTNKLMSECSGCTIQQYQEEAASYGAGIRYIYDYNASLVKKYSVSTLNGENFTVTESAVEPQILSGFQKFRGVWLRDSRYFAKSHVVRMPIGALGPGLDPVGISLYGSGNYRFTDFKNAVDGFLTNTFRVRAIDPNMADVLEGRQQITVIGVNVHPFYIETSNSSRLDAAFELQVLDGHLNEMRIAVNSSGSWTYLGTWDSSGDLFPNPDSPRSGNFFTITSGQTFAAEVRRALPTTTIIGAGDIVSYVSCAYVGKTLLGCEVVRH